MQAPWRTIAQRLLDLRTEVGVVDDDLPKTRRRQPFQVPDDERLAAGQQQRLGGVVGERPHAFAAAGSETATTVWPATAAGATTVNKVFGYCDTPATGCDPAWGPVFPCPLGQQCIVRVTNTDAMSVNVTGVNARYRLTGGAQ